MRRWLLVGIACVLVLAPAGAGAQLLDEEEAEEFRKISAHPAECSRLRRQIAHYEGMLGRAQTLHNQLWEARLEDHLDMLKGMQAARCPNDIPVDNTGKALKALVKLAAKAALTYFTFGAAGF